MEYAEHFNSTQSKVHEITVILNWLSNGRHLVDMCIENNNERKKKKKQVLRKSIDLVTFWNAKLYF